MEVLKIFILGKNSFHSVMAKDILANILRNAAMSWETKKASVSSLANLSYILYYLLNFWMIKRFC